MTKVADQPQIIQSYSDSQEEILGHILRLYVPDGKFDVDPTYSQGQFYASGAVPEPTWKFDIDPQREGTV